MPKKKPPKKGEIPQKERFVTAARSVGASEAAIDFDRAFSAVVKSPSVPTRKDDEKGGA